MSKAREIASKLRKKALGVRSVSDTPYATHLPVLAALSKIHHVRHVLELGSGPFSTSLFLDKESFPELERLVSYEDDTEWAPVVLNEVGDDPRLDFRVVDAVRNSVPDDLTEYDLIFIDDSRIPAERSVTIGTVAGRARDSLVVVHDFEQRAYRRAASPLPNRVIFKAFTPQVGVLWAHEGVIPLKRVRNAAAIVEANSTIAVTDRAAWRSRLAGL